MIIAKEKMRHSTAETFRRRGELSKYLDESARLSRTYRWQLLFATFRRSILAS